MSRDLGPDSSLARAARTGREGRDPSDGDSDGPSTSQFLLHRAPGHLLRRLEQIGRTIFMEEVSDSEVTAPQFAVLFALHRHPGIDQITLSRLVAIDRSTIASLIARLEDRGWLFRARDAEDSRRNLVSLTSEGADLLAVLLPEIAHVNRRLLEPLDEREQETFVRLLEKLVFSRDVAHTYRL